MLLLRYLMWILRQTVICRDLHLSYASGGKVSHRPKGLIHRVCDAFSITEIGAVDG